MPYFKPYIDEAGLHIPTYTDTRDHLIEQAKLIFGQDIYLGNDSQDYQFISIVADKIHDTYQTAQLVYNNRGPSTASGGGLDGIVKLNGISRKRATQSTCLVEIVGVPSTRILNGIIQDSRNMYNWELPSEIIIPQTGKIQVIATCQVYGPIFIDIGDIDTIVTPTQGWSSVYNYTKATLGQAREKDSELRARQAISTALPSKTILDGTKGAIAAVKNVTRSEVYENDTDQIDINTLPPHSICAVVEGGDDYEIAEAIYNKKTPGCYTHGDIEVNVIDAYGQVAYPPIRFFRPRYKEIYTTITIKKLRGFTSDTMDNIILNTTEYLNSIAIGDNLSVSAIWGVALTAMTDLRSPSFSIVSVKVGLSSENQSAEDIIIAFNEVTKGSIENIVVNVI